MAAGMRLLFIHDRFGAMAGAEVNAYATAAELKARGHDLAIVHGPGTGMNEDAWREVFADRFPLTHGNSASATEGALRSFRPDMVYLHKMTDLAVIRELRQSSVPVVRMVHDHDLYCMRGYKYFPFSRRICTRAAGFHCVFPCGAVLARSRNGRSPVSWVSYRAKQEEVQLNQKFACMIVATGYMKRELLRNGFDPHRIEVHGPVPPELDLKPNSSFDERNRIIYAGQIIRGKGVDVLIEALASVQTPFECVILGDGNHRSHCESLSQRLGLSKRVRFEGYVSQENVQEFYSEASVAVVSSIWPEPFGAVGIEAMRHGLPVVAFDAGGISEWLIDGENGFLVPWMDRARFAARIEQLLRDKALARKLGEHGRHLALEKFDFDNYISGLESLFARVVNENVVAPAT